ncbi:MAG: reverse transcriptase-like protein [Muribaculaceae bacterium]|nr:reverse transcriptase-like protein [Muribaculaceae bacterium]
MARRSPAAAPSDPRIRSVAIAVDGACSSNPGPMEYRGVMVGSGQQVFHVGPLDGGTNNIGEYLALVHALALLDKQGDHTTPIYSDSRTALSWLRRRHSNTKLEPTARNAKVFELLERADRWVATHQILNPVLKWDTDSWGEIPADFGRK